MREASRRGCCVLRRLAAPDVSQHIGQVYGPSAASILLSVVPLRTRKRGPVLRMVD
jgi:hypothetical protein